MRAGSTGARGTAALLAALVVGASLAGPAQAAARPGPAQAAAAMPEGLAAEYVALGDSFAAGPLILPQEKLDPCFRSTRNYPHVLAKALHVTTFRDVTCSSATTANILGTPQSGRLPGTRPVPPQIEAVTPTTTLVTVTIGANDIDLADLALSCLNLPPRGPSCRAKQTVGGIDRGARLVDSVAARLAATLDAIRARAPRARIVITSYANYVRSFGCYPRQPLLPEDANYIQGLVNRLGSVTERVAARHHADYVDFIAPGVGHDGCEVLDSWVTLVVPGLTLGLVPLHPTALGERNFAKIIAAHLQGPSHSSSRYAPLNRPGPKLRVPAATMAGNLECTRDIATSPRQPVLFVAGSNATPEDNFGWNYERAITRLGIPWCAITLPHRGNGDLQVAAEYVIYAIRAAHARSGKKVQIVGHSLGGIVPRWALRFWPDVRAMVDDFIAMGSTRHGTTLATAACASGNCSPAAWQLSFHSPFIQAMNSGAAYFAGISYTDIYTETDENIVPNRHDRTRSLPGGGLTSVSVQSICPGHVAEHLLVGTADPVAYALVVDALTHRGPAKAERIDRSVCRRLFQPGVNPVTFAGDFLGAGLRLLAVQAAAGRTPTPPPLAAYTRG